MVGRFIWAVIVFACVLTSARSNAEESKPQPAFWTVGYLPEWRINRFDVERCALIDELIYFSIEPTSAGLIDAKRFAATHREKLAAIRAKFPQTRVRVAIGGWGRSDHFAAVSTDAAKRKTFIDALVAFCRDNAFVGADFDWEFPKNPAEADGYASLLAETKVAFKPHGWTVSVAVNRTQKLPKSAIDAVDAIHLMAYDDGERHATPERAKETIDAWLAQGAPAGKLVLGVPFYGRSIADRAKAAPYADLVEKHHPAPDADEAGGFYFNGVATIVQKTRTVRERKLGGIMIWEVAQDVSPDHPASLLQAIRRASESQP